MSFRHSPIRFAAALILGLSSPTLAHAQVPGLTPPDETRSSRGTVMQWSLERRIEAFWREGLRDDTRRLAPERSRILRGSAAGMATGAGLSVVIAGLSSGERRQGSASPMPVWGAGAQTRSDLAFVLGTTTLLGSALLASLPLDSGFRRVRPTPIGGKRWGGVALKWRF